MVTRVDEVGAIECRVNESDEVAKEIRGMLSAKKLPLKTKKAYDDEAVIATLVVLRSEIVGLVLDRSS